MTRATCDLEDWGFRHMLRLANLSDLPTYDSHWQRTSTWLMQTLFRLPKTLASVSHPAGWIGIHCKLISGAPYGVLTQCTLLVYSLGAALGKFAADLALSTLVTSGKANRLSHWCAYNVHVVRMALYCTSCTRLESESSRGSFGNIAWSGLFMSATR